MSHQQLSQVSRGGRSDASWTASAGRKASTFVDRSLENLYANLRRRNATSRASTAGVQMLDKSERSKLLIDGIGRGTMRRRQQQAHHRHPFDRPRRADYCKRSTGSLQSSSSFIFRLARARVPPRSVTQKRPTGEPVTSLSRGHAKRMRLQRDNLV